MRERPTRSGPHRVRARVRDQWHPYGPKWGWYWRSQEEFENQRKAGYTERRKSYLEGQLEGPLTREVIDRHNIILADLETQRKHEKRLKVKKAKVLKKHGLDYRSNRNAIRLLWERTGDPEVREVLVMMSTENATDTQKLDRIRALFTQNRTANDIIYNVAVICGVNIRKQP